MPTNILGQRPAIPRITARVENHLRDIEWRFGRLTAFVAGLNLEPPR